MGYSSFNLDNVFTELDKHCRVNGRYDFTVPYLIKISRNRHENLDIHGFIVALVNGSNKYIITLCSDLDEIIIGLHKPIEHAPLYMYPNFGNLHYDETKIGLFKNLKELSAYLTDKYLSIIKEGKFSKNIETLDWE